MFCNNENCELKKICFRFLPKHSKSKDLYYRNFHLKPIKSRSITDGCLNYIKWTYGEEEQKSLELVKAKANKFYDEHTTHIDKLVTNASVGYSPSKEDINSPMLWKPEHWLWFLKRRNS